MKTFKFSSNLTHHHVMAPRSQLEIENESTLFQCDYDFAKYYGGVIIKEFLNKIPQMDGMLLDSKVHFLEKGWAPARFGFHTDFVARNEFGEPNFENANEQVHYMTIIGENSSPEFVIQPLEIEFDEQKKESFYHQANNQIEAINPKLMALTPYNIFKFTSNDFHRVSFATKPGFRLMIRASFNTGRKAKNRNRKQVQVFLPNTVFR